MPKPSGTKAKVQRGMPWAALAAGMILAAAACKKSGDQALSQTDTAALPGAQQPVESYQTATSSPVGNMSGEAPSDANAALAAQVRRNILKDKKFSSRPIDFSVEAQKGEVTLKGFVNSRDEKSLAARIARETPGVKSVVNQIEIRTSQEHG